VRFILAGSILLKQPAFAKRLGARLQKNWPGAIVSPLERESAWGAVALAQKVWDGQPKKGVSEKIVSKPPRLPSASAADLGKFGKLSPTEQRNPRSRNLDKLSVAAAIKLMLSEDARIPAAVLTERKKMEK